MTATVRAIINAYLAAREADLQGGLVTPEYLDRVHRFLGEFAAAYGERDASEIRPPDVKTWVLSHPSWKSAAMRQMATATVIMCWRWAEEEAELIDYNRVRRVKPFWDTMQPRAAITPDEVRAMMHEARISGYQGTSARVREALFFLRESGARTCEMRRALWEQLDWQAGLLKQPVNKTRRKTGLVRLIPLSAALLRLLRRMHRRAGYPTSGTIFLNGRGRAWTKGAFAKIFRAIARRAGVRECASAYSLRHGFCCGMLQAGIGERQVADVMGHTTTRYVEWYSRENRMNGTYLRSVLNQFDQRRRKTQ